MFFEAGEEKELEVENFRLIAAAASNTSFSSCFCWENEGGGGLQESVTVPSSFVLWVNEIYYFSYEQLDNMKEKNNKK